MGMQPSTGTVVAGKYRLLEHIGSGGMAEVYRAENLLIGRSVALKLLAPDQLGDDESVKRFFLEAQTVNRIGHPNIVDILDAGEGECGPFIVMEFLDGRTLAGVLRARGKLPVGSAVAVMLPVLDALGAAHEHGIVHRDLKPENIFVVRDGDESARVKLLDFGVAKLLEPGASPKTRTGIVFGTPDYLSPEQATGEAELDARSDLFSAGTVLFEMLTGERPFRGPSALATAYKVTHGRAPTLAEVGGPEERRLEAVLMRALRKRREERYARTTELASELAPLAPPESERPRLLAQLCDGAEPPGQPLSSGSVGTSPLARPTSASTLVSARDSDPDVVSEPITGSRPRPSSRQPGSVRGLVLRAVDAWVAKYFGEEQRAAVHRALPDDVAREARDGTLQAIVVYDLQIVSALFDTITSELMAGKVEWARVAGAEAVSGDLAPVLRSALRPAECLAQLRRISAAMSGLINSGHWAVDVTDRGATLKISGVEGWGGPLRLWVIGVADGVLRSSGSQSALSVVRGEGAYAPQLVLDVVER